MSRMKILQVATTATVTSVALWLSFSTAPFFPFPLYLFGDSSPPLISSFYHSGVRNMHYNVRFAAVCYLMSPKCVDPLVLIWRSLLNGFALVKCRKISTSFVCDVKHWHGPVRWGSATSLVLPYLEPCRQFSREGGDLGYPVETFCPQ